MRTPPPTLAVVGLGVWGEKLLRVALRLNAPVHGFDLSPTRMKEIQRRYPDLTLHASYHSMLSDPKISAVIVATPSSTHYSLAKRALDQKKHVLIEKPMTQNATHARELIEQAKKTELALMVDHTFLYSSTLMKAKQFLKDGTIGHIAYIESRRLGGVVRPKSTVLWDLAPHDVAIANALIGSPCTQVQTLATPYVRSTALDHAIFSLTYSRRIRYIGFVSWIYPKKIREVTCIGTRGAFVLSWSGKKERLTLITRGKQQHIPCPSNEPLENMMKYFFEVIRSMPPQGMYQEGYDVVRAIVSLHTSWRRHGAPVSV